MSKPFKRALLLIVPFSSLDMVNDAVIPMAAIGIQYFGGPVVTILASKTSRMYDTFFFLLICMRI